MNSEMNVDKGNRMNRFDRKSFKQASRRKANDILNKIKNLFGKEVTLDKIRFDNEYCIDFDGTVDGKSAYISIAIEKWPGYTGVTIVVDNDVFSALVRGGASEAAKYLSENFTILSGEDKLFKEAKDHDEALHTGNRAIAGKHNGASDFDEYMKSLESYLELDSHWTNVRLDYDTIYLDDEDGNTHSVMLDIDDASIERRQPELVIFVYDNEYNSYVVDTSYDPKQDAHEVTCDLIMGKNEIDSQKY